MRGITFVSFFARSLVATPIHQILRTRNEVEMPSFSSGQFSRSTAENQFLPARFADEIARIVLVSGMKEVLERRKEKGATGGVRKKARRLYLISWPFSLNKCVLCADNFERTIKLQSSQVSHVEIRELTGESR